MVQKLIFFFILSGAMVICNAQTASTTKLVAVEIKHTMPDILHDLHQTDTEEDLIYYYSDMTMYRISYSYDSMVPLYNGRDRMADELNVKNEKPDKANHRDRTTDTIYISEPRKSVCSEERYHFVVFKNGSNSGYNYDNHDGPLFHKSGWVKIDSILKYQRGKERQLCNAITTYPSKLVSSSIEKDQGTMQQVYDIWDSTNTNKLATYTFDYNNSFRAVDASLSKQLDSLNNSKLCHAHSSWYEAAFKKCGFKIDKFEMDYSLSEITVANVEEVMGYFNRFLADDERREKAGLVVE